MGSYICSVNQSGKKRDGQEDRRTRRVGPTDQRKARLIVTFKGPHSRAQSVQESKESVWLPSTVLLCPTCRQPLMWTSFSTLAIYRIPNKPAPPPPLPLPSPPPQNARRRRSTSPP